MKTLTKVLIIGAVVGVGIIGTMYYVNTHKDQITLFFLEKAARQ